MHQPSGSIWFTIFVSAMPRDLKQLVKTPDLVEQYVKAFGKEEKLKQARAHSRISQFVRNATICLLVMLDLDLAGWL